MRGVGWPGPFCACICAAWLRFWWWEMSIPGTVSRRFGPFSPNAGGM